MTEFFNLLMFFIVNFLQQHQCTMIVKKKENKDVVVMMFFVFRVTAVESPKTIDEKKEREIDVNYCVSCYDELDHYLIEFVSVLFVLISIFSIISMKSLQLLLIKTFCLQNLQLSDIAQNCDKYHYYLSLLQLPAMKLIDSYVVFDFFDVLTIFSTFSTGIFIFSQTTEEAECIAQRGGQTQESPPQSQTAANTPDKENKANNINYDAFDILLNVFSLTAFGILVHCMNNRVEISALIAGAPLTTMDNRVTAAASNFDTIRYTEHLSHFRKEIKIQTSRNCVLTA